MSEPAIDLSQFTGFPGEIRPYLCNPIRVDGYLYATNGHLMVRIEDDGRDVPETDFNPTGAWPKEWPVQWHRITDDVPEGNKEVCNWCGGNGRSEGEICDECYGRGVFQEHFSVSLLGAVCSSVYLKQLNDLPGAAWGVLPRSGEGPDSLFCAQGDGWRAVLMPLRWGDEPTDASVASEPVSEAVA